MRTCNQLIMRAAHSSEATLIASMSRLHVEHGLQWRWTPKKVRQHIRDKDAMVLVASIDGEISGFAIMKFGETQAHLYLLAVDSMLRRQGTGSAMVRWLEKSCITAGITNIRLEVRASNQGARQFYAALGFRYIGQVVGYYDRRETAIIMGKSLISTT